MKEKVEVIRWTRIFADYTWSLMLKAESSLSIYELQESIREMGQRDPIVVRKNPDYREGSELEREREFVIVLGFRRYDAIDHLNRARKAWFIPVRCYVREMTGQQGLAIQRQSNDMFVRVT